MSKQKESKAKYYLKSKNIWVGTLVVNMGAPENYFKLDKLLEAYHQSRINEVTEGDIVKYYNQYCKETMPNNNSSGANVIYFGIWLLNLLKNK